ncbi:MAG: linear amide C-N hydrolase [Xanthobacter sp.]
MAKHQSNRAMRFSLRLLATGVAGAALLAQPLAASACTSLLVKTKDGDAIYGRTMEFSLPLNSEAMVMPRKTALVATGPDSKAGSGKSWTSKYGVIGLNALGMQRFVDGMNEKGLTGGLLYLPGLAEFQDVTANEAKNSIASWELLTYVLTSFATVDEVKENLPKIKVNRAEQDVFKSAVPLHMTLHDATGASLVVEYIGGKLQMHDNPTGVLTNAPAFDWHIANLGQYLNLNPKEPAPFTIGGLTISAPSTGAGLHGIPGDVLSPSRFVRAFIYSQTAPAPATREEGVLTVSHIMNNFDIPPGSVVTSADSAAGGGVAGNETTEWTVYADIKGGLYYFNTYQNPAPRMMDIHKVNLDADKVTTYPIEQPGTAIPVGQ